MNIYLVGFRCTGKTTVGKLLSQAMGWLFVDTDEHIVKAEGRSIAKIVKEDGWAAFRGMELRLLESLARREDVVVSTGGGIVLDPENIRLMKGSGRTVWLKASPRETCRRMMSDPATAPQRPALTTEGPLAEIEKVLKSRGPLYRSACDLEIDTDEEDPAGVVRKIMGNLR
ncbi:MAG: shikimate kinase [Desulfobacterales bacterium]